MNINKKLVVSMIQATLVAKAGGSYADEIMQLEEVTVTARKRVETMQEVPISIQALSGQKIADLGLSNFQDYAVLLPSLSFTGKGGPGTNILYMRGSSDGGNGNPSGSHPGVAMYLDEQPVSAIGADLDIHLYDIERIEALAGPQGTLYGASSQSGTLRIVTKKPELDEFSAGVDVTTFATKSGDPSHSLEGFVNQPLGERAAIRIVGWESKDGGYIDNVKGTRRYNLDGNYGGHPIPGLGRTDTISNDALVEENFNERTKRGARAALRIDLNDQWLATVGVITQSNDTTGSWDHDPQEAGELQIKRFFEDKSEDDYTQVSLELEGELEEHTLTYSLSNLDRDNFYQADYTAYGEQASWVPYYACDYTSTAIDEPNSDCTSLKQYNIRDNSYGRQVHELRLQSLSDGPLNYVVGAFYDDAEVDYKMLFIQPGMSEDYWAAGIEDNFYRTDQVRTDKQRAIFGEISYGLSDALIATLGARRFWNESQLQGGVGYGDSPTFSGGMINVDSTVEDQGNIYKANISWHVDFDRLLYLTFSEGYRMGGLNRDASSPSPDYAPDLISNHELGWKTSWMDNRLRVNGALYYMVWDDMQFSYYDVAISPVSNVYNVGEAEIKGLETDISYLIAARWTVSLAASYNDGKTAADFILFDESLVSSGTELPNVSKFKGSLYTRYSFNIAGYNSFAQLSYSYTGRSYSHLNIGQRQEQDAYSLVNIRFGVDQESWAAELFVDNATDERAQLSVGQRSNYEPTGVIINRPRNVGLRLSKRF